MTTENTILYPIAATYKYNGTDFPINFKSEINIAEMGALVQSITSNVVDEDGYYPYLYDYALFSGTLSAFTDFSETDVIEIDTILNHSNIMEVVANTIDSHAYANILTYVDSAIEFQKQKLANKSEFDGLISDIRKIVADVNERFIKPADDKVFQKLIKNLSGLKLNEKSLVDALIKAKVIDKNFSENNNKEVPKGKVINFKGQQNFDGAELVEDEIK